MNPITRLQWPAALLVAGVLVSASCAAEKGAEHLKSNPRSKPAAKPEAKKPDAPKGDEDKPFDEVVKDMEVIKGLFTSMSLTTDRKSTRLNSNHIPLSRMP